MTKRFTLHDLRLAARLLLKERWFSLAAVTALALGIGANTTIYTIVSAVMLREPVAGADRLLVLTTANQTNPRAQFAALSYLELQDWKQATRTLDLVSGYLEFDMNVADDVTPAARFEGAYVSADSFGLVGVQPVAGRDFRPDDERPGAAPVIMLSHQVWTSRYGGDPAAVGRVVRVGGIAATVVGVMPEGFGYPQVAKVWRPLGQLPEALRDNRSARPIVGVGRMRPGVTIGQARTDLARIAAALAETRPDTNRGVEPRVVTFSDNALSRQGRIMISTLMVAVALVLLIACANVANLVLARAARRTHEISVRLSLGASRWRIVRQLIAESLLLAIAAGAAGLALAVFGVGAFARSLEGQGAPYWLNLAIDGQIFGFVVAICLGTVVIVGLVPALQTSRAQLAGGLSEASRRHTEGLRGRRLTGGFVVAQLTLTLVLLTGATLSVQDLVSQLRTDVGIRTADLTIGEVQLPRSAYPEAERRAAFYRQLEERLAAGPGVQATLASAWPSGGGVSPEVTIAGRPHPRPNPRPHATQIAIGTRYFETLGTRLVRGRTFTAADSNVAIVNERFAAAHFPDGNVLGQQLKLGVNPDSAESPWLTIVGVAPNVRQRTLENDPGFDPVVYVPYGSGRLEFAMLVARSPTGTEAAANALREHVRSLDPDLPVSSVMSLDTALARDRWEIKFLSVAFGLFAAIALVLATVGLYAVTAYAVSRRTREIGLRMALGAQSRQVWWLVTRRASIQLLLGLTLGMPMAVAIGQVIAGGLRTGSATNPGTYLGVVLLLAIVALGACVLPARRAMRLDPGVALRVEG